MKSDKFENYATEKQFQQAVVNFLRFHGYSVFVLGFYRTKVKCPFCNHFFHSSGSYGNARGAPDLIVSHDQFPQGVWVGVELKRPGAKLRLTAEQKRLYEKNRIFLVASWEDADRLLEHLSKFIVDSG